MPEKLQSQGLSSSPHPTTSDGYPIPMHWNKYCRSIANDSYYATKFPEVIPLKTVDAEQVNEALVTFFSGFCIPREI